MNNQSKKWTIEMLDKEELIHIINAMFKNGIPDLLIQASRYNAINRKLRAINASLGEKSKTLKKLKGKKREDLIAKGVSQYRLFNKLVKENEELLIVLKGTDFDPFRDKQSKGNETLGKEA